jgi:hypothetical protein
VDLAREACGGARVKSSSKAEFLNRIFIGSHSLPPLWFAILVLQFPRSLTPAVQRRRARAEKNWSAGDGGNILWSPPVSRHSPLYISTMAISLACAHHSHTAACALLFLSSSISLVFSRAHVFRTEILHPFLFCRLSDLRCFTGK